MVTNLVNQVSIITGPIINSLFTTCCFVISMTFESVLENSTLMAWFQTKYFFVPTQVERLGWGSASLARKRNKRARRYKRRRKSTRSSILELQAENFVFLWFLKASRFYRTTLSLSSLYAFLPLVREKNHWNCTQNVSRNRQESARLLQVLPQGKRCHRLPGFTKYRCKQW